MAIVVWLIQGSTDISEFRALKNLLHILVAKEGTFRETKAWLCSGEIAGLTAALIDTLLAPAEN